MNTDHRRPTEAPPVCLDRAVAADAFDLLGLLAVAFDSSPDVAATMPATAAAVGPTMEAIGDAFAATVVADEPAEVTP